MRPIAPLRGPVLAPGPRRGCGAPRSPVTSSDPRYVRPRGHSRRSPPALQGLDTPPKDPIRQGASGNARPSPAPRRSNGGGPRAGEAGGSQTLAPLPGRCALGRGDIELGGTLPGEALQLRGLRLGTHLPQGVPLPGMPARTTRPKQGAHRPFLSPIDALPFPDYARCGDPSKLPAWLGSGPLRTELLVRAARRGVCISYLLCYA